MDLKVVLLVVFLSALAITSTNASIPSCCISTQKFMPRKMLSKVERLERQYSNGVCDIDALKLYLKGRMRPICIDVQLEKAFVRIQNLNQQQIKRI
uniref:Chemokine interleukin-8-like domain-containing protein n=1 Tax=Poecilia latipinna TaxID=48699 RepID=A0A3B3V5R5_9TELE